jgi:hypothetical protein
VANIPRIYGVSLNAAEFSDKLTAAKNTGIGVWLEKGTVLPYYSLLEPTFNH